MKFHAPTGCFVIEQDTLKTTALEIRYAMQKAREMGGFPMEPHKREGAMTPACHLEHTLLSLADRLGIDMGARWPGQLDLRDKP